MKLIKKNVKCLFISNTTIFCRFFCAAFKLRQPRSTVTKKKTLQNYKLFFSLTPTRWDAGGRADSGWLQPRHWACVRMFRMSARSRAIHCFFFLIIKSRRAGQRSRSLIISTWPAPMFVCVLPQKPNFFQAFKPSWSDTEGRLVFKPTRIIINNKLKKNPHQLFWPSLAEIVSSFFSPPASCWSRCYLLFFQADRVEKFREMSFNLAYLFPAHLFLPLPRHPTTLPHPAFLALQLF